MEKRRLGQDPELGEHVAECVGAVLDTSAAGNRMVVWTFELPGGRRVNHYTVRRRAETALTAQALGLGKSFRLSEALGCRCRVAVSKDGAWLKVSGVRPL